MPRSRLRAWPATRQSWPARYGAGQSPWSSPCLTPQALPPDRARKIRDLLENDLGGLERSVPSPKRLIHGRFGPMALLLNTRFCVLPTEGEDAYLYHPIRDV